MKKVKIETEEEKIDKNFITCPFCDQRINGTTKVHVISNFQIHVAIKHKGEEAEVKE